MSLIDSQPAGCNLHDKLRAILCPTFCLYLGGTM
jgi:hypothetical protein